MRFPQVVGDLRRLTVYIRPLLQQAPFAAVAAGIVAWSSTESQLTTVNRAVALECWRHPMTVPTSVFSDELFDEVSLEWDTVCREVDHHKQAAAQEVSSEWSTALPAMESEFQQLITQGDWQRGPEDIFSIIGLERNEVRHSAMMAWLLDPLGRHGFGTALLEAILEECFPATKLRVRGTTTIVCEVARGDTRAGHHRLESRLHSDY